MAIIIGKIGGKIAPISRGHRPLLTLVERPVDERRPAGSNEYVWNGDGDRGAVASGLYFVRLEASRRNATGRFVLLR
jgi:hypothetical protein